MNSAATWAMQQYCCFRASSFALFPLLLLKGRPLCGARSCCRRCFCLCAKPATQIAMLIEHLKADDINLRVTATRSLPAIADALGHERVRAELVPFINDSTDDEDEVDTYGLSTNFVVAAVDGCGVQARRSGLSAGSAAVVYLLIVWEGTQAAHAARRLHSRLRLSAADFPCGSPRWLCFAWVIV